MTLSALSSYSYTYSTTFQYQYFGNIVSNDRIDELMKQYGIVQSGDKQADLRALYNAMYSNAQTEVLGSTAAIQSGQAVQPEEAQNVPWANLMKQVGLSASGELDTDYDAFNEKIEAMKLSATSPMDKANINQLEAESAIVFVQQDQSVTSQPIALTGDEIRAQLNKMYFFG